MSNAAANPHFRESTAERSISYSEPYSIHQLVPLLCNVIMCGLNNFIKNKRTLLSLSARERHVLAPRRVLKLSPTKNGVFEGTLEGSVRGDAPTIPSNRFSHRLTNNCFQDFYIIDFISSGSTSKVFQAVSVDGHLFVIKMYVKWIDDDDDFQTKAKKSMRREVANYRLLYPELEDHVWHQELNSCQCVIMPYFAPLKKQDWASSLDKIQYLLTTTFKKAKRNHPFQFAESDRCWRHVGTYNNTLYLFDLADLARAEGDDFVDKHMEALKERLKIMSD